jgi:hypothetical protein
LKWKKIGSAASIGNLSAEIAARHYQFAQAHRALSADGVASQVCLRWRANYLSFRASFACGEKRKSDRHCDAPAPMSGIWGKADQVRSPADVAV